MRLETIEASLRSALRAFGCLAESAWLAGMGCSLKRRIQTSLVRAYWDSGFMAEALLGELNGFVI